MEKNMTKIVQGLGMVLAFMGLLLYGAFSWGFVFYKYWNWFVLPVFDNLPVIAFKEAVGLMLVVGLFKNHISKQFTYKDDVIKQDIDYVGAFVAPWVVIMLSWIVKLFL